MAIILCIAHEPELLDMYAAILESNGYKVSQRSMPKPELLSLVSIPSTQ